MEAGDRLAAALERLPGVLAASAFLDAPAGVRVYIAASRHADMPALREAALGLARDHRLDCDPERVHIGIAPTPPREHGALPRVSLDGLDVHRTDHQAACTVRLRSSTRTTSGSAQEPDTRSGRARAAALACLRAAEGLDPDLRLGLEGLRVLDLFGFPGVVVLVDATAARSHAHLPGAAVIERSVEEAACLAALAALRSWTF